MARPRSEDKRNAILAAAIEVIAEQGLAAPTSRIAKVAGVAEGTLFTYFDNKDELFNALYVQLKSATRAHLLNDYPTQGSVREQIQHVWQRYVSWGVAHPHKRVALSRLVVSDSLTAQSRALGMEGFQAFHAMLTENINNGLLRQQSPQFVSAILGALAETTMDFMLQHPGTADEYARAGFEAFWRAIGVNE